METTEALKIITSLADGRDPGTGSPLPDTDPCQRPKSIRALYLAATELGRRARRGDRAGQPWDDDEDDRLVRGHEGGSNPKELARAHQRSLTAIQRRLEMLGKIPAPHAPPAPVTAAPAAPAATSKNGGVPMS